MRANAANQSALQPAELLFGAYHRRLLALLLMRPEQSFHLREIERLTRIPSGPAHRELKRMERAGLLSTTRLGNQVRYQANRRNPIFPELQGIVRKTVGLADVLRNALKPLEGEIELALIFGSVARGEEGPRSDVDLLVVGDVTFEDVVDVLFPLHEQLGRQINPVVMNRMEFARRRREQSFMSRVMRGEKILLMGSLDEP
jgi:predicted nucleotidyltransferase